MICPQCKGFNVTTYGGELDITYYCLDCGFMF